MKLLWFLTAAWSLLAWLPMIFPMTHLVYSSDNFVNPVYDLKNATYIGGKGGLPFSATHAASVIEYPPTFDFVFHSLEYLDSMTRKQLPVENLATGRAAGGLVNPSTATSP